MSDWDASQYTKFEKERTQPAIDLIRGINALPRSILDIGCGPGNSTNQLYERFPKADILGIDQSDNMLDKAKRSYPRLHFLKCALPDDIDAVENFDLIFSNACLHWIPDHKNLFPKLMNKLNPGGTFAAQTPLVQNAPFYKALNRLLSTEKWKNLRDIRVFHTPSPNETYDILSGISKDVTMWETTYYHVVPSPNAVIDWYKGSGLRPYLDRLNPTEEADFLRELLEIIKDVFPTQADRSVLLKMPRLFFVARKE